MHILQKSSQQVSNAQITKNKKINKNTKNEKVSSREENSQTSKAHTNKNEIRDKEFESKHISKPSNIYNKTKYQAK